MKWFVQNWKSSHVVLSNSNREFLNLCDKCFHANSIGFCPCTALNGITNNPIGVLWKEIRFGLKILLRCTNPESEKNLIFVWIYSDSLEILSIFGWTWQNCKPKKNIYLFAISSKSYNFSILEKLLSEIPWIAESLQFRRIIHLWMRLFFSSHPSVSYPPLSFILQNSKSPSLYNPFKSLEKPSFIYSFLLPSNPNPFRFEEEREEKLRKYIINKMHNGYLKKGGEMYKYICLKS